MSEESGIPLDVLRETLESMGFAWTSPDGPMREDELEVVPVVQLGLSTGILDRRWLARAGRAYAEGLRLAAAVETELFRARFEEPVLASGLGQRQATELAGELAAPFMPLVDRALMGIYRRQQELSWTEHQVENIETALEEAGALVRPERMPAMCFLDLAGYTRLTEEQGDQAAAELASTLAVLVERSSRGRGGTPVKWLGDGVMLHFRDPPGAVEAALAMVVQVLKAGLPGPRRRRRRPGGRPGRRLLRANGEPGLPGRRPGPGRPGPGHRPGGRGAGPGGVSYADLGDLQLKGFSAPVHVLEARRA